MSYGFRLFTFKVHEGMKRSPTPFEFCGADGKTHYLDIAQGLLTALRDRRLSGEPPRDGDDPGMAPGAGDVALRVHEITRVENTLRLSVYSGRHGNFPIAMGEAADEDIDIADRAASRPYRIVLTLPRQGEIGILGAELISRSSPISPVQKWLRWTSRAEAQDGARWWRPAINALSDGGRLADLLEQGQIEDLVVVRHSTTSARTRQREAFRVTSRLSREPSVLKSMVKKWEPVEGRVERATKKQAAKDIASLISDEIDDLEFEDGWIVVKDPGGGTKKVSPDRMSEIFTYKQTPDGLRLDDDAFYARIRDTARPLQDPSGIQLDWP